MEKTVVRFYGVHRTPEGVVYLHQGKKSANFIALAVGSPFEVEKKSYCPHLINVGAPMADREQWKQFMDMFADPITRLFLPIPKERFEPVPFLTRPSELLLLALSRLSSPTQPIVQRFDARRKKWFVDEMQLTNVAPLVLTGVEHADQPDMEVFVSIARSSPRRLILGGAEKMIVTAPEMVRMQPCELQTINNFTLHSLPMETLGAVALRRWARGEQIDGPWERPVVTA